MTEESEHTEAVGIKAILMLLRAHFSFCQLPVAGKFDLFLVTSRPVFVPLINYFLSPSLISPVMTLNKKNMRAVPVPI